MADFSSGGHYSTNSGGGDNDLDGGCSCRKSRKHQLQDHYDADHISKRIEINLAAELNELSVEERESVFDNIHGVAQIEKETPEFVAASIGRLEIALNILPPKVRRAYDRAKFLKPTLETADEKFKLMFLRADHHDASKAARRMAKYFADKLEIFGEDKLVKQLTLQDLREEDRDLFKTGFYTLLPNTDSVGRPICFCDFRRVDFTRFDSMLRCSWYQSMTFIQDDVAQLKGFSSVTYSPGEMSLMPKGVSTGTFYSCMVKSGEILKNLPARPSSFHWCYDSKSMEFILRTYRATYGKSARLHLRTHYGSSIEVQYSLLSYGIQCPYLLTSDDDVDATNALYDEYYETRYASDLAASKKLRQEAEESGIFPYPNPNDVLVGRGKPYQQWIGNVKLGELLDAEFVKRFRYASRFEKTCIHLEVIKTLELRYGAKFLERTPNGWIVADEGAARRKVNSAFRSKMAKLLSGGARNSSSVTFNTTVAINDEEQEDEETDEPLSGTKPIPLPPVVSDDIAQSPLIISPTKRTRYDLGSK